MTYVKLQGLHFKKCSCSISS